MKECAQCGELKPLNEFSNNMRSPDGKTIKCKLCNKKNIKEYNSKRYATQRQNAGKQSMYENKSCSQYFGIVVGEKLCQHIFNDVEVMPHSNPGFDIICNRGKKIDIKSACLSLVGGKYPQWSFEIKENKIADYFIFIAFNNRTDLDILHMWMFPGDVVNNKRGVHIGPSTVYKWKQWERSIEDIQICCTKMKNVQM